MDMAASHEYTIPAGKFSHICGTTRDTLRYYDKNKVLIPWTDPENGYHYYSYAQIGTFYFISTLRSINFSIKDIRDLLFGDDVGFMPYVTTQLDALKEQRQELDRKIRQISVVTALEKLVLRTDYGVPTICDFPSEIYLRVAPVSSENAFSLSDIARDIQDHIHLFPDMAGSFPAGTAMDPDGFLNGDYRYIKVVSLAYQDDASLYLPDAVRLRANPGSIDAWESVSTFSLPTRKLAAIVCRDTDGDITAMYRRLADFIKENDLTMLTDVFSISIVNMIDPNQQRKYLKFIFVCVA